jgi:PAS domain S-box-containing protein
VTPDDVPVPLWVADAEGRRSAVNRAWVHYTGRPVEGELGYGWANGIHPDDRERCLEAHRAAARERRPLEIEYRLLRADGTWGWLLDRAAPRHGAYGEFLGHIGSSTDITELKQVEAELRQAEKMGAVSRLAGGVAHGFNNLLTAVLGYSDLIEDSFDSTDPRRETVAEIKRAAERGAALTQQLLALGRSEGLRPEPVDVNDVARDTAARLRRLLGPELEVRTSFESRQGLVRVDPAHLEQAIMSLGANARDAMPEGGTVTIATADDKTHVVLVVEDTGIGMDDTVRAHLFEPFFTTKEQGRGAGLGLASVYGLVKQSGGRIEVDSEQGRGSRFSIYLPRAQGPATVAAWGVRPEEQRGAATILLVEDEPLVRRVAEDILSRRGHRLLVAPTGEDAIALAAEHAGPIDVLVTDIVMPGMSGLELAEHLTRAQPGLRVIYMSGYADEGALRLASANPAGFLSKPFSPEALASRVDEALAAAA